MLTQGWKEAQNLEKDQSPPPPQQEILEAIATLIYASSMLEIEELQDFGRQMAVRYGMDFAKECLENKHAAINYKVSSKLTFSAPDQNIVFGYLKIIAEDPDDFDGGMGGNSFATSMTPEDRTPKIKRFMRKGVPHKYRPYVWLTVTGALTRMNNSIGLYRNLLTKAW